MSSDELVVLRTFGYRHEGELAENILREGGVSCALFADDAGGAEMGLTFSNQARLMVRRTDLAKARALLEHCGLAS